MEHLFSLKMRLAPSLPSNHGWIMDNEIQVVGNFSGYETFPILVISNEAYVAKGLAPMCVRNGDRRGEQMVAEFSFLNPFPTVHHFSYFQGDEFMKMSLPLSGPEDHQLEASKCLKRLTSASNGLDHRNF